jgi:hypothetical protein
MRSYSKKISSPTLSRRRRNLRHLPCLYKSKNFADIALRLKDKEGKELTTLLLHKIVLMTATFFQPYLYERLKEVDQLKKSEYEVKNSTILCQSDIDLLEVKIDAEELNYIKNFFQYFYHTDFSMDNQEIYNSIKTQVIEIHYLATFFGHDPLKFYCEEIIPEIIHENGQFQKILNYCIATQKNPEKGKLYFIPNCKTLIMTTIITWYRCCFIEQRERDNTLFERLNKLIENYEKYDPFKSLTVRYEKKRLLRTKDCLLFCNDCVTNEFGNSSFLYCASFQGFEGNIWHITVKQEKYSKKIDILIHSSKEGNIHDNDDDRIEHLPLMDIDENYKRKCICRLSCVQFTKTRNWYKEYKSQHTLTLEKEELGRTVIMSIHKKDQKYLYHSFCKKCKEKKPVNIISLDFILHPI